LTVSSFPSTGDEEQEFTRVYYGSDTVIDTVLQFLNKSNNIIYACVDQTRPSLTIDITLLKEAFLDARNRGVKLLYVTEINRDNLSYCKQLLTMVDDLTQVSKLALEYHGFKVNSFNDAQEALSKFKPGSYDLVILDIKMPKMDGFELYDEIKKKDNNAKVCFLTASELYYEKFKKK
jgi:CheY-like chemotaxis protein